MLYYLTKADFEKIMGSFVDLLDGNDTIASRSASRKTVDTGCYTSMTMDRRYDLTLDELIFYNVLGRGAFGRVTLVQGRDNKKLFALKAQCKDYIVKRRKQEHVMNEYRIMKECHHPNVLGTFPVSSPEVRSCNIILYLSHVSFPTCFQHISPPELFFKKWRYTM